jgi:FtsH-binding integral membrane protein
MPPASGVRSPAAPRADTAKRLPHLTLNTDGKRHPVENVLAVCTLVAGLVACIAGFLANYTVTQPWAHVIATWLGLATMLIGLYSQLVSATRQERMLIVTGLVAGFVGLALGLANGGLF